MRFFIQMMILNVLLALPSMSFAKRPLLMSDFYRLKYADKPVLSFDDQWIVYEIFEYDSISNEKKTNLWLVSAETGESNQLTFEGTTNEDAAWSPDNKTIAFVSDRSGVDQVWIMDIETLTASQITHMEEGAYNPRWSPDGSKIAFLSEIQYKGRNPEGLYDIKLYTHLRYRWWYDDNRYDEGWRSHLFITDIVSGGFKQLTNGDYFVKEIAYSPAGDQIAFVANRTQMRENNINTDIWLIPANGGDIQIVYENHGPDYTPVWSHNGRYLAWRSTFRYNYESDNYDIMVKDFEDDEIFNLTEQFDRVVRDLKWDRRDKDVLFIAGDHGNYNLYQASVKRKKVKPLIELDHRIRGWDVSGTSKMVVLARTIPTRPAEIYVTHLGKKTMKRISYDNDELLQRISLQDAISVTFTGANDTPVQGWYITPPDFDPGKKYPLVLHIHGGPQGMFKNQFDFEFQITAAWGAVVFYCNPRGSFGYGQQFTDEIRMDYGGVCYRDIMAGVDYILSLGFIDENRMGVTGHSFGGWMTSWIIGHTNRFTAAVPSAPFVNMLSFYGTTDEQFFPEWDFDGQPYDYDCRKIYEKNSPINYAKNFRTPTLIIHGEEDWRCHITESEQLFTALKKMQVPVIFARIPGEPHVYLEPHHREAVIRMKLDWWQRYLKE